MVILAYAIYLIAFILYSWFLFKSGKRTAEEKDTVKMTITGKPEQIKEALKAIIEQDLIK